MFRTLPSSSSHRFSCVSFVQSSSSGYLYRYKWIYQYHPYHVIYSFATFHRVSQCQIIAIITCNRTSEPSTPPSKSAEELSKKPPLTIRKAITPPYMIHICIININRGWGSSLIPYHHNFHDRFDTKAIINILDNLQYVRNLLAVLSKRSICIMLVILSITFPKKRHISIPNNQWSTYQTL